MEEENIHDSVFGVSQHLFEPTVEAGSAASKGEMQVYSLNASHRQACVHIIQKFQ